MATELYEINENGVEMVDEWNEAEVPAEELDSDAGKGDWKDTLIKLGLGMAGGAVAYGAIELGKKVVHSQPVAKAKEWFTKPRPKKGKKGEVIEADFTEAGEAPVEEISEEPKKGSRTRVKKG